MKKFILILYAFISGMGLMAQTPLGEAVDFSVKDIYGNTHQLFDILDNQEKFVLIDFFSVTCGPCQTLAPKVDSVYRYFGYNDLDLYVMAIDQTFDNEAVMGFESDYNIHFPAVSGSQGGGSSVYEAYQIPYYPSLILIAPDHTIVEQAIPVPNTASELIELLETYELQISSVEQLTSDSDLSIFPNPATSQLFIEAPQNKTIESIQVYSITGREILQFKNHSLSNSTSFSVENLDKGIYLISVLFENGERYSTKFAKK